MSLKPHHTTKYYHFPLLPVHQHHIRLHTIYLQKKKKLRDHKSDGVSLIENLHQNMVSRVNAIQASTTNAISHLLNEKDGCDHWGQLMASYLRRIEQPTTSMKIQLELQTLLLKHIEECSQEVMYVDIDADSILE